MPRGMRESQFPDQGSNLRPPALATHRLNQWSAREVPLYYYF